MSEQVFRKLFQTIWNKMLSNRSSMHYAQLVLLKEKSTQFENSKALCLPVPTHWSQFTLEHVKQNAGRSREKIADQKAALPHLR